MKKTVLETRDPRMTSSQEPNCQCCRSRVQTSRARFFRRGLVLTLVLLGISAGALAETVYVSDRLEASLRRGDGTKFQILRMVRSGDALEKLEETSSGYTKVRTPGGTEGYILSRYLMDQPAAREQIDAVSAENQQLRQTIAKLETRLVDLQSLSQDQSGQINSLESEKQQLGDELSGIREATADVMSIKRQNVALGKQVEQLNSEKEALATENRAYRDNTKQDWFIRGAGVVIVGILIGLILPKLRRRRRWGEL